MLAAHVDDRADDRDSTNMRALSCAMASLWSHKASTFRALRATFGKLWVRCDVCRRYAPLSLAGLQDVDYRTRTFSCSKCGSDGYLCIVEPIKERGMEDYRLDRVENTGRHPEAGHRRGRRPDAASRIAHSAGELPGRRTDPRR
jgi:hypothetical protein